MTEHPADVIGYDGRCSICGWEGYFHNDGHLEAPAQRYPCGGCGQPVRFRDEAHVLVEEYGQGRYDNLDSLIQSGLMDTVEVYYIGVFGPVRRRLRHLPCYRESAYDPRLLESVQADARRSHQDVQHLTFENQCLDLVISNHVMEHVPDPWLGFAEIARVLRPGGRSLTSIPVPNGLRPLTKVRASIVDGQVIHLAEPSYHNSPEGEPALTFTDFGMDLVDRLAAVGLDAQIRRPHLQHQFANANLVVVAQPAPL